MRHFSIIAASGLLGMSAVANVHAQQSSPPPMKPSGIAEAMMSNDEKDFFESAASANMFEVASSRLALTKASDPALKQFAQKMIDDHTQASQKLETLAKSKNVTLPTTLLGRHQKMLDTLQEDKAGKEFDDDYREQMVASHKEAVSLFDQTAKKAKDPDVKSFAMQMLPKLQAHGGAAKELENKKQ
ncbi:DUF4142 domain-containing protein [Solimonas soli]|uniref:DUF4142 domain-containing protein n=1 Tax=Solimonas soli TaxID=413479 RepID=UPI000484E1C2|nr:DUF4142 domain-containing protein [Solimonas soli]